MCKAALISTALQSKQYEVHNDIGINQYEGDTWCSLSGGFFPFLGVMEYKENVLVWASERGLY